jgi:DNA primase
VSKLPREIVDAVRERTDIVEIVQRHVALKKRGRQYVGLCPFHQEKSPSFNVIPEKGIYHCFGCQAGGDVFRFLMTLEGLTFFEAVKELGDAIGVEVEEKELSPAERKALKQRATAYDVLEAAAAAYESWLWTGPAGAVARKYLLETRAMTPEAAKSARLGWSPGGWSRLLDYLHQQGFEAEQVANAGLAKQRERGDGYFDFLRERLIIPIRDERGRVIAFGGRILEGDQPKYLNTPESAVYKKSNVLYGIEKARFAADSKRKNRLIVVEGYFDVLALHGAGFEEAVATCGTALTPEHLEKIRRLTRDVILVMDADDAGLRAAERTLPMFVEAGIQAWRVELPGAKDPDELLRKEGPERFEQVMAAREPLFEWVVRRRVEAVGTGVMGRERALEDILPLLARLRDPSMTSRVSVRLGLPEEVVLERIRSWTPPRESEPAPPPPPPSGFKASRDLVHLLWLVVHRYDRVADVLSRIDPRGVPMDPVVVPTLARMLSGEPVASVLRDTSDPGLARTLQAVVARDTLYDEDSATAAVLQVVGRLVRPEWNAALGRTKDAYEQSVRGGDVATSLPLLRELKRLQDRDKAFDRALKANDVDRCVALLGPLAP